MTREEIIRKHDELHAQHAEQRQQRQLIKLKKIQAGKSNTQTKAEKV